jgi:DNA modification methylase
MSELPINTIVCGNCLDVMKGWPDKSVDLVFYSPPYNMRTRIRNGQYTTREQCESGFSNKYKYFNDALSIQQYFDLHFTCIGRLLDIAPLVFINIQIVTGSKEAWFRLIGEYAGYIKDIIVWDKGEGQPAMHDAVINRGYELIILLEAPITAGRAFNRKHFSRGTMPDIWRCGRGGNGEQEGHSATFPVSLPQRAISGWTKDCDIILDPFCGSGTTCVAAKMLGRRYIGIDISPEYCKIAQERLLAVDTGVPVKEARKGQKALFGE